MMKHYIISALGALALTAGIASCSENEPISYVNDPALYFDNDDVSYSFFYNADQADRDTIYIKVHAMGYPSDADRAFSLVQTNAGDADAAQSGVHYVGFDSSEMSGRLVIPQGKNEVDVPVILLNDASLETSEVKLRIGIKANDNFGLGIVEHDSVTVTFSAQAIKPNNWADWYYAFGASWGTVKMRFIIEHTGISDFNNVPSDYYYLIYLNEKLKSKLYEYNAAHPDAPLAEADGTLVEFDNPYIMN